MNKGTEINQLLSSQDFNWHNYGTVNLYSTPAGLKVLVHSRTDEATWFHIVDTGNNTYQIAQGLHKDKIVADGVSAEDLSSNVHNAIMNK